MKKTYSQLSLNRLFKGLLFSVLFLVMSNSLWGQTYNLKFERVSNNGTTLTIKVQMSLSSAENLGTSNLVFTYDGAELNTPVLGTIHNFSGGNYQTMTMTTPTTNTVSLNIELTTDHAGTALATGAGFTDVAEISFTLPNEAGTANFQWQELNTQKTVVYQDDNDTRLSPGTFTDVDMSLDGTAPSFSSVSPSASSTVPNANVGYTLSEAIASGTVTFTRTGGTADGSSPHVVNLIGSELNTGTRASAALTNVPALVEGAIYTISFDGTDAAGNTATQVNATAVTFEVNNEPTFTIGANQTVSQSAGAQTVNSFISTFDDGDATTTQTTQFNITGNTNASLFTAAPAISAAGVLTFTPDATKFGKATISVTISDDGGTAGAGDDTSPSQTFDVFVTPDNIKINEVHAGAGAASAEFIEIYNTGASATSLSGLVVVWFNGSDDQAYKDFDLTGSTSASGFYVIGETGFASKDQDWGTTSLQDGPDAVALYVGSAADFTGTSAPTTDGLVDVIVYGGSDDVALRAALGNPALQPDGDSGNSISRSPDGTGSYVEQVPSAQATNDVTAPTVTSVSSSTADGTLKVGDAVVVTVTFSENVTVTGTPQLTLETGSTDRTIDYNGTGSGTTTLEFGYTVQAGDNSSDLDYVATTSLSAGTSIQDAAGNDATLTLASPGATHSLGDNKALVIDGVAPTVASISSSAANGTYKVGDEIILTVTFSEVITVLGDPTLTLEVNGGFGSAIYNGIGSRTNILQLSYIVESGDVSTDLDYETINSFGGRTEIQDAAGNDAILTLASPGATNSLGDNKALVIDGVAPTVTDVSSSTADGTLKVGDAAVITVTFSEAVSVTGTPQLTLETGSTDRTINYNGTGSGTNTLEFGYTVQAGDNSSDLDYVATTSLSAGTSIQDAAGNDATRTLATSGAANSLGANKALVIDGVAPTVTSVTSTIANGTLKVGDAAVITVTFSEAVTVTGTPQLILETGTVDRTIDYNGTGSGTTALQFGYTVQAGDVSADLDYVATNSLTAGTSIQDDAGNNATLTLATPGATNSLGANKALVIDGVVPTVTSVSIPNSATKVDDAITVTITAGEAGLSFNIGMVNGVAVTGFSDDGGGSYSATYTVAEGNTDKAAGDDIPVSFILNDAAGNSSATFNTAISQNSDAIDANTPSVTTVSIPNSASKVGDAVTVSITASEAGLSLSSGTVNGVSVTGFSDDGSGNYSAIYTVAEGNTDRAAGDDIPVSFVLDDAASNSSATFNTAISQNSDAIDANTPSVTTVSIPNSASKVGDAVTVSITASEAGLSLSSGTVNGVSVTGFSDDGGGSYSAIYTVAEGNTDRAAGDDIPVSFVLDDAASNSSATFNTAISQNADAIDANTPTITSVTIPNSAIGLNDAVTVTIIASEAGLSLNTGTVNGVAVTGFTDNGSGNYSASYTALAAQTERAAGDDIPVSFILDDAASNSSSTFNTAISQNADEIDLTAPTVTSVTATSADGTYNVGEAVVVTVTFSEVVTVAGTPTLALETGGADRMINYNGTGTGTMTLEFGYTVQSGDVSGDLAYKAVNSLTAGTSIKDAAGNDATLTLPTPGAANSLSDNKDLVIAGEPTVTLSVGTSSIVEAAGTSTVTVTLSAISSTDVTVTLAYAGTAGTTDYNKTTASTSIVITAGNLSNITSVGVTATQDIAPETNETIIVDITGVTNGTESGTQQQTITITDDDTPNVSFAATTSNGLESVASSNIPVNLSLASGLTVTVDYAVTGGTATGSGTDFTLASGTLTFNPASTTENIPLAGIINDLLDENDETVIITLSSPGNANLGTNTSHTYTITDNDNLPTIAFTSTTSSGTESVSSANLEAALSAVSGRTVTVDYAIVGTATGSGTDFTLANGTLTITESNSSNNITIASIVDDALDEFDETVIVTLSNPVNATLGTNTSHTYTITDNDTAPIVAFVSTSSDGLESVASANLQVDLSGVSGKDVMVDYTVTGTATGSGTDYTLANGTLTFTAASSQETISIASIVGDDLDEDDETVIVTLSSPTNATLGTNTVHTYTILDDDDLPLTGFVTTSSNGDESTSSFNLSIGLTGESGRDIMLDYTVTGTATGSGTDHTVANGTFTIEKGNTGKDFTIPGIVDDLLDEDNETVIITLSNPVNATLPSSNAVHTYTITDNDDAPTVAFALAIDGQAEDEASQDIQVSLSAISGKTVTVDYAVSGTATSGGVDHTTMGGTITFNPGEQDFQQQITGIVDDALDEENETIILTLSNPGNATLGTTTAVTYTITDNDDEPLVTLSVGSASIAEAAGTSSVTATLSAVSGKDITVNLGYTGTATNGTDYNNTASTSITINAGQLSASAAVGITATQDANPEGNETIIVDITGVTNGAENGAQQQTITLVDDDAPVVTSITSATADGNYKAGDLIEIQINFNQAVSVIGTPQLTLETGATDRTADYASGDGTSTLTFNYTVQAGDVSSDLDYVDANSLTLNSGTIIGSGLNAVLDLATPAAANSLGANAAIIIDTSSPVDPVVTTPASDLLLNAATQTVSGTHAENGVIINLFADSDNNGVADNTAVLAMATVAANAWTFDANLTGDAANNFVVQAKDDAGNTSSEVNLPTITEDSTSPVISSDGGAATASLNVNENTTAVTTVTAADDNTVTLTITGGADQALFSMTAGVLSFTNAPDFESAGDADTDNAYVVEVTASDGVNMVDTQTITVTVVDQDDNSPVITSDGGAATAALNMNENATVVTTVTATDADGVSTVTYSISGGADQALFSMASGVLTFTNAPDFENAVDADTDNAYVVEVTATDGTTTADTQTITVTVVDQDDNSPIITSDGGGATAALNVNENATAVTTVTATDADGVSTVAYSISGGADQALFSMTAGVLTFTNAPDLENPGDANTDNAYVVEVTATDGVTTADTQTITVTVVDQDDNSPVITSDGGGATATLNVNENATAITTVIATDADGVSTVAYSISGGADQALFSMAAGVLTFTNAPDFETPGDADTDNAYVVEVTATDGTTTADTQTITITVDDLNDISPVITASQSFSIDETVANSTIVGTALATDADAGTTFSGWTITAGNGLGIFAINTSTGGITVIDNANLAVKDVTSSYVLTLSVTDGANTSATETVTINILDSTAPAAPLVVSISDDTGSDASDGITSDQTLSFTGTAEANSIVEVFIDGSSIGSVSADAGGSFTFDHTGTTLPEGNISVTAKAKDASTNESGTSSALAVMIDRTIPSQPTLAGISDDNGPDGNDFVTNDRSIIFSGKAEALSRVGVLFPGGNTRFTTADGNGDWILDFSFREFFAGSYLFSVTAEDLAGNTSIMSNEITLVIDLAPPTVSGIARANANPTAASSVDFTATFSEDVSGVEVGNFALAFTGTQSANIARVTAVSANTYTITVNNITGEGSFGLNLNDVTGITDIAGNTLNGTLNGEVYVTNFSPTDIDISSSSISENNAVGDAVGGFNTTDIDAGDTHAYSLVSGTGDTDNTSFTISGSQLQAAEVFDLETKASYSVRVQTDDGKGGTFQEVFTITIDNVPEADLRITGNNEIPATPLGITTNFDITVHNDGDATLNITSVLYPTAFGGPVSGITVAAGASQVVTLTFTPTLPQIYTGVITIVTNGGTGTLNVMADGAIVTGVDTGLLTPEAINVYPNPASSFVTFDLSKFNGKSLEIQLFDLLGNKTFSTKDYQKNTLKLDVSAYQQGIYLVRFTDGKSSVQKKFMIKK